MRTPTLAGWGGASVPGREHVGEDLPALSRGAGLSRGLGRSYGDSSLPGQGVEKVVSTRLADRLLAFDPETGLLLAEAGLSLVEVLRWAVARGFWVPSVPGTQYVTLGGMVASDVHGKSHHRDGTFGRHVRSLLLRLADDRLITCSREENSDLFRATLGGMGLTGHILEVELELERSPSPWIWGESLRLGDLDGMVAALRESATRWPFTVGWLDTLASGRALGRGVLFRGRWAEPGEAPRQLPQPLRRRSLPFYLPEWALSTLSVSAFNRLYYLRHRRRPRPGLVHPEAFFFPLDAILGWNRLYGRRGFTQYQCVLPEGERPGATRQVLAELAASGAGSFLAVIKDCGPEGEGLLSFPRPGVSIAVDLPMGPGTQALVDRLNGRVIERGGRIYLTKDTLTRREHFQAMEAHRLLAFLEVKRRYDPEDRLRSAQYERLMR
ncbi:MAG: FAD-binding oxidoreductase [Thermoanaerobaculia bacterium]